MFLWTLGARKLPTDARKSISDPENEIMLSAASIWEISIKRDKGKLRYAGDPAAHADAAGFVRLPITFEHAIAAGSLPRHHRDPFDRMLVAQARLEGLTLATADRKLARYDVPILDVTGS